MNSTRNPRSPRYALTVNGQPVQPTSTYRDGILDQARETAYSRPHTTARVIDTRTGTFVEYTRGATEYDLRSSGGRL